MMSERQITVITPNKSLNNFWRELWDYRDLFYFLAWRDFKVRYKQTIIGVTWAILRPLLTMLVFTIVFGKIAKLPTEGDAPYAIMVFSAMLPWYFFSSVFQESSQSLISNASMLSKVYFPRIIIPTTSLFVNGIDFLASCFILLIVMAWYQYLPSIRIFFIPLFLLLVVLASLGVSLWISALNVKYRDFRYIVPFIIQFGLFISPVGFSSSIVSDQWRFIYSLNPMVGVIDGFRWAILGGDIQLYMKGFIISVALSISIFFSGVLFFQRMERKFADII
ncbi:MAG: ABC transporter permease [Endozoicomonadaceae bacterium]|nr:ABC transporter permease [Endozoicomonadaceae bacterium]